MQGLYEFMNFDLKAFLAGKVLQAVSCGPLTDYQTKEVIGTRVGAVITEDTLLGMAYKGVLEETVANPYADEVRPTENAKCGDLFREVVGEKNPQSNTPPQGRTAEKEN